MLSVLLCSKFDKELLDTGAGNGEDVPRLQAFARSCDTAEVGRAEGPCADVRWFEMVKGGGVYIGDFGRIGPFG